MNRRRFFQLTFAGAGGLLMMLLTAGCGGKLEATAEGGQRYMFLDDNWLKGQSGVTRTFHIPDKEQGNPVITVKEFKKGVGPYTFSWENKQTPYTAWFGTYDEEEGTYPAFLMTSVDGLSDWTEASHEKSDIMSIGEGNKQCFIYMHNKSSQHGDYAYLGAVGFRHSPDYNTFHWRFRRSHDGIHWEKFPDDPIWDGPSDVMQIFWDEHKQKFVAYYKVWRYTGTTLEGKPYLAYGHLDSEVEKNGTVFHLHGTTYLPKQTIDVKLQYGGGKTADDGGGGASNTKLQMSRVVGYAESSDFLHWENEQIIIEPSADAPFGDQSYGMSVACKGNMYISMYSHFNSVTGLIQPILAWSYDGIHFSLHDRQFFVASGKPGDWDYGMILISEPVDIGKDQLCIYYGSLAVDHKNPDLSQYHGALGRAWLRKDGYASLKGGQVETVPLRVQAQRMSVNMTGEVGVTVKSVTGKVIGKAVLRGDHLNIVPDIDLSAFLNCDVIIQLDLSAGELYAITI